MALYDVPALKTLGRWRVSEKTSLELLKNNFLEAVKKNFGIFTENFRLEKLLCLMVRVCQIKLELLQKKPF